MPLISSPRGRRPVRGQVPLHHAGGLRSHSVMEHTLGKRALNRATLARQMLLAREKVKVVAAIERIAGMQAQLARPPFVGLWTRIENFERDDLRKAIAKRDVVRATMMRGTIHLMSRRDYLAFR